MHDLQLLGLKRKRHAQSLMSTQDSFVNSNPMSQQPDDPFLSSDNHETDSKHWRKLRLLEARLVGRVLGLQQVYFRVN